MKLRSMVKSPLMDISHKNASIICKQKSAGRQVKVVEKSHEPSKNLLVTPAVKKSKISTRDTHLKKTSTLSGKVSKIKHSAAKRIPELKKAGRGKKSQNRNTKLVAAYDVLSTGLDSIVNPTVIKNNRYKVMKDAQKSVKQKPVILSNAKPTSKKSSNTPGRVSRNEFSLINEIDFSRIGKKPEIAKLPVSQTKKIQSVVIKQPTLYSNVVSVNSTSSFTSTVFRKQSFRETQNHVTSSDSTKTSIVSLRFERTEEKEQNDSKIPKQIQSVSQNMNYIAPTNYISFCKASRCTKTSVSNKIAANKSPGFKKSSVGKNNITENITPQSRTIKARNQTRYVLQNKQTRNKPEKRKAKRKSQVTKAGATKQFGRKQTQPLARKHKEAVSVVRNRTLRGSSQKRTQSSKKHIPHTSSVAKKSKSRSDADQKKTAVVEVSEVPVYIPKRLQKMAKETRPITKLSSLLTLKSSEIGNKEQFAGLTKTTVKKSVVRKQRTLTSEDHLPKNKSLRALKQYTPLLAIEVTPIQSLVRRSLKSATSSPTIVSSLCKAAEKTTLSQSKKNEDLNQTEIMLPSENVSRRSYSSKFTSTPILAYSSYRIEKASPLPTRKNMTSQLRKKSATKQTKKNTVSAKMNTLFLNGTSNRPLRSAKNIPSLAAKVTSSQKSHKPLRNSPKTENENALLQRKRSLKIKSSLISSTKKKKASLSERSTSARSVAEPVSQLTNVTDIAFPSNIRKGLQRVSAVGKKTSRQSKESKKRKPVTNSRNVKGLSHINIEDNLELIKNVLSQSKLSKKSVSSVLNRHPKDFSREEKSLISLRKKGPSLLGKVKKPALRRVVKRAFLPEISVKAVAKSKKDNKTHGAYSVGKKPAAICRVSNKHSDKNAKLGVKLKERKPFSPTKQIMRRARIIKDAKLNLSYPEQTKALKAASRQKVTEISCKLQNLAKANKLSKLTQSKTPSLEKAGKLSTKGDKRKSLKRITSSLINAAEVQRNSTPRKTESSKPITLINKVQQAILTQSKTLPTKKSVNLSTKEDKRKSLTGMTTSLVKATEVQASTMVIPKQTETPKPKTLIMKIQQTVISPSQKKIITQSKEKVTKAVLGEMFVCEISPKLSSKGGIKKSVCLSTRKRLSLGRVAKVEMMNWLTPGQNKALQLLPRKTPSQEARYVVSSQSSTAAKISANKRHLDLPKIIEGRKPAAQSKKQTRSTKTTENEKINLVSRGQKKSAIGNKIQKTKTTSTSPKKMGKKKLNKVADNILLNKVNPKLLTRAKATKLIVPSAKMTRLGKVKEIERIGLVPLGQKKTLEALSHGGCKIAITKSSTLTKKKGKKGLNKNNNSGKKLPHRISSNKVKRRTAMLSLPKMKVDGKAKKIDNISLALPGQNEKSKLSPSVYKMQKAKSSSAQKKTQRKKVPSKIDSEILSKKPTPKLSIKRTSVTSSPNISGCIKAKKISIISSEQDEAPKPLPDKYNTQKTKIFSSSKKSGKKKKAIGEKCKILSSKVSSKISTKMKRRKSVAVSQKITRRGRSKDIKEFLLASLGNKEALKQSPRARTTRKIKLSAISKKIEKKKTVKKIPSKNKIHSSKVISNVNVNIDASISSPTTGRSTSNKRRTYPRYSLVPQGLKKASKQLSARQKNKKHKLTDVPKRASLGIMPDVLAHTRGVKSTEGASNVSFQRLESVYTLNKSHRKSQPSRNISTVLPFNLVNEYASSETSPSQLKKTTDIIYNRQLQNISSPTRRTAQKSPGKLQHVYEGLGRRSLLLSDTSFEWKMADPLDTEIAGSGYRRKDHISLLPEKTRAESYICNVNYTRNDREDRLPVSRTTQSPQTLSKKVSYSEQSRKVSTSKVSFSSPIGNVDGHTRYIASTPFPVRGKSAVSSMHIERARNSDSDVEMISGSQPFLSFRHNFTRDLRLTNPVTSHMVSERENDEESIEDPYTQDGFRVETEKKEKLYINREEEENEELEENTRVSDVYAEEIGKDGSTTLSPNSHAKQCIIS